MTDVDDTLWIGPGQTVVSTGPRAMSGRLYTLPTNVTHPRWVAIEADGIPLAYIFVGDDRIPDQWRWTLIRVGAVVAAAAVVVFLGLFQG